MAYLVTGATGFIGRHLMERLLANRQGKVYVLVREASTGRLDELTDRWRAAGGPSVAQRIVPVLGDLRRPLLGLLDLTILTADAALAQYPVRTLLVGTGG